MTLSYHRYCDQAALGRSPSPSPAPTSPGRRR